MQPNPVWVNRILTKHWDAIEARIGWERMPQGGTVGKKRRRFEHAPELGCGHYGCVLETQHEAGIVFKLTSDVAEAAFVAGALSLPRVDWPAGMIRYHDIFEIPGETHYKRPVFGLLRDEAYNVGKINFGVWPSGWDERYGRHSVREGFDWLMLYRDCAHRVRMYLSRKKGKKLDEAVKQIALLREWAWRAQRERDEWPDEVRRRHTPGVGFAFKGAAEAQKGARSAAIEVARCEVAAEMMANIHFSQLIGEALDYYQQLGMLLADVHFNNIGEAVLDTDSAAGWDIVVTDPGHMVPLKKKWTEVRVPVLGG